MNHEIQDLARRAVACKHWRWMPGMRAVDGAERFRVSVVTHGYPQGVDEQPPMKVNVDLGLRWLPDLTDPATLGCLLALVREAHGIPAWLRDEATFGGRWSVCWKDGPHSTAVVAEGDGPDAALVAALEAAP